MGAFKTSKNIPCYLVDLSPVVSDLIKNFEMQGFEVSGSKEFDGTWHVSITKGGTFKAILGMKSSLNVVLKTTEQSTYAEAGIGIFGQQAIPTIISMALAWPVLITQVWGLIQQAHLDDEALTCIEDSLKRHGQQSEASSIAVNQNSYGDQNSLKFKFCSQCGTKLPVESKFCSQCGVKQE